MSDLRALRLNATSGVLEVEWAGGERTTLSPATLRERCMCAECRNRRQHNETPPDTSDVTVLDVVPYGPNAVQLVFSDGHARGIFPFSYLRTLAERAEDTQATTDHGFHR